LSDTLTDVRTHAGEPIAAIRNMVKGDLVNVAKQVVIRIGRSLRSHVVIEHPNVSRRHAEITQLGPVYRVASVGKNPVLLLGTPVLEGRAQSGDWIQVTEKHLLLLLSQPMVDSTPALEFFVGHTSPVEVSRLLQQATTERPLLLVGHARNACDHLAREIHRVSRRSRKPFIVANPQSGRTLADEIEAASGGSIYVDLEDCRELDLDAVQAAALATPPPVRVILGASSAHVLRERIPELDRLVAVFRVPDLAHRPDRMALAARALAAHGLEVATDQIGVDVLRYVVHHDSVHNLGQVWQAPVRLAALVETKGVISSANDLLRRWGHRQGENTLGDWIRRLEIDTKALWGVDRRNS